MSTRTVIEINHDHLNLATAAALGDLLRVLGSSQITGELHRNDGRPLQWGSGIRVLGQRHHSETLLLEVK